MLGAQGATQRISVSWTAGTVTVLAAVAGKKIRVLGGLVNAGAAGGTVKFQSKPSGAGADLTGVVTVAANGRLFDRIDPAGYAETVKGEALLAVVTGAFDGILTVQKID